MNFYYSTNQDGQFEEQVKMDNTKADNELFTNINYLTERRDPLGGRGYERAMKTGLGRII